VVQEKNKKRKYLSISN